MIKIVPLITLTLCATQSTLAMTSRALAKEKSCRSSESITRELFALIPYGSDEEIARLLNADIDLNARNFGDNTLLMQAARENRLNACLALIQKGANLNAQNICGETALMQAASYAEDRICALLLDAGADPFVMSKHGETAISNAGTYFYKNHRHPMYHPINTGLKGEKKDRERRIARERIGYQNTWKLLFACYQERATNVITLLACLKNHEHPAGRKLYSLSKHLLRPLLEHCSLKVMRAQVIAHAQRVLGYFELEWVERNA